MQEAQLEAEVKLLRKENEALRRHIAVLQAEVYGARLAAKYLDKELAGRCVAGRVASSVTDDLGGSVLWE